AHYACRGFPEFSEILGTRHLADWPAQSKPRTQADALVHAPAKLDFPTWRSGAGSLAHRARLGRLGPRLLQAAREGQHPMAHDFSTLEFDRGARRNGKAAAGHIWIAADPRFAQSHLEYAKIPQFHGGSFSQGFGDMI